MNEEALNDAYSFFVNDGYNGSVDDFSNLLTSNPEALNDAYNYFTNDGYTNTIEDFSKLLGLGKTIDSTTMDPTGESDVMGSDLEDGSLESSRKDPAEYYEFGKGLVKALSSLKEEEEREKALQLMKNRVDNIPENLQSALKKIIFEIKSKKIKFHSTILFSPSAASFDTYKNFEERGKKFNKLLKNYNLIN